MYKATVNNVEVEVDVSWDDETVCIDAVMFNGADVFDLLTDEQTQDIAHQVYAQAREERDSDYWEARIDAWEAARADL